MDREAFRTEVATHMVGQLRRLDAFFNVRDEEFDFVLMRQQTYAYADLFATWLEEPASQEAAAERLCTAMFGDEEPPKEFWKTEAGRAVALAIGYPRPLAPRTAAAAILGLTRQRVDEMIKSSTNPLQGDRTHVSAPTLRAALRARVQK